MVCVLGSQPGASWRDRTSLCPCLWPHSSSQRASYPATSVSSLMRCYKRKRGRERYMNLDLLIIDNDGLYTQGLNGFCPHGKRIGSSQEGIFCSRRNPFVLNRDPAPDRSYIFSWGVEGWGGSNPKEGGYFVTSLFKFRLGFVGIIQTGSKKSSGPASVTSHYFR